MENKQNIFFSVVCPVYNAGLYLHEALQSVLDQTVKNWELIIVDDGSTDNTAEIAKSYTRYPSVQYVWQPNGKQGKARNLGVSMSRGNFIAFLDADDIWTENKLERQIEDIKNSNASIFFTGAYICDEKLNVIQKKNHLSGILSGKSGIMPLLLEGINPIIFNSVVVKTDFFRSVGAFNETNDIAEDYEFFLRVCEMDTIFYANPDFLVKYRVHIGQTSESNYRMFELCINGFIKSQLKTLKKGDKNRIARNRISKYILHNIDELQYDSIVKLLTYYPDDIRSCWKKIVLRMLSNYPELLKCIGYNYAFLTR
jgi:teichuronic acid biosynthesis glycosyltransferase TuaG